MVDDVTNCRCLCTKLPRVRYFIFLSVALLKVCNHCDQKKRRIIWRIEKKKKIKIIFAKCKRLQFDHSFSDRVSSEQLFSGGLFEVKVAFTSSGTYLFFTKESLRDSAVLLLDAFPRNCFYRFIIFHHFFCLQ